MKWFSTLRSGASFERAIRQAVDGMKAELTGPADIGLLFFSSSYRSEVIDLWPSLMKDLPIRNLIGCSAGGVIGGGKEIEEQPAVSLTAAQLPGVTVSPFQVQQEQLPDADSGPREWRALARTSGEAPPHFVVLSDPFSLDIDALIAGLDFAFPNAVKVGGLASGGQGPNENLLLSGDKVLTKGGVALALSGDISVEAVVAQGCRPIGEPLSITACDGNVLVSVNNQPPLAYLQELYETLDARDQELLQTSLFLGIVMDPFKTEPRQGDFLIRNIIGLDQQRGLLAIGTALRQGQAVQFHLRDAATSRDDLRLMLSKSGSASKGAGAVLFSCVGRGRRLYGQPNHDSELFKSVVGNIPVGGFFCNGEIGPVGGKTYLHGYTSSIAVFSPSEKPK